MRIRALICLGAFLGFFSCSRIAAADAPPLRLTFTQFSSASLVTPSLPEQERGTWLEQLPVAIRAAEGKPVEITGYLLPLRFERGRATQFLLMRDQSGCCYGKMPAVHEYLFGTASASGLAATMDVPVTLRGTLRIAPLFIEGALVQLYTLEDAAAVRP